MQGAVLRGHPCLRSLFYFAPESYADVANGILVRNCITETLQLQRMAHEPWGFPLQVSVDPTRCRTSGL
jgi:hypothetical protein